MSSVRQRLQAAINSEQQKAVSQPLTQRVLQPQQTQRQNRITLPSTQTALTVGRNPSTAMGSILQTSIQNAMPKRQEVDLIELGNRVEEAKQTANEMSRMESSGMTYQDFQALEVPGSERFKQYRNAKEARQAYQDLKAEYETARADQYLTEQNNRIQMAQNSAAVSDDYNAMVQAGATASIPNGYKNLKDVVSYITDWNNSDFSDWRDRVEFGMDHAHNFRDGAYNVDMMSQLEKNTVLYYVGKGEYDKASEYLDDLERTLNRRANSGIQEQTAQQAQSAPVLGAIAGIATWPLNIPAALDTGAQAIRQAITGEYEPADPYRDSYALSRAASGVTQGVQEAARQGAADLTGSETAGDVAGFLAGAGLSIGQNAMQALTLGPAALPAMAASAAGQSSTSAIDRGGTYGQAAVTGAASGVIEALTEKIPLDNLFRMASAGKQTARETVQNVLRQMGTEATEESISEIANNIVDTAVMGENSEYRQYVNQLVQSGVPKAEAEKQAFVRFYVLNTLQSAAGGALSGGVMGGGASLINYMVNRPQQTTQQTAQPAQQENETTQGITLPTAEQNGTLPMAEDFIRNNLTQRKDSATFGPEIMSQPGGQEAMQRMMSSGELGLDASGNFHLNQPDNHIDNRSMQSVGDRSVNAFQFDNPSLHNYFKDAAEYLMEDLRNTMPGQRWSTEAVNSDGSTYTQWTGMKRSTTPQIAQLLDDQNLTYDQIWDAVQRIINDQGQENVAAAKRVELVLDDMLTNGWRDVTGYYHEPNQEYIASKQNIPGAAPVTETSGEDMLADVDPLPEGVTPDSEVPPVVQRLSHALGRNIQVYDGSRESGTRGTANGYYANGTIYVNSQTANPIAQVIAHELTHSVEMADAYQELSSLVLERIRQTGGNLEQMRAQKADLYQRNGVELNPQDLDSEIVAEYVEKNLLTDEASIQELTQTNRTLAQRIRDWIDSILAKLGNTDAQSRVFLERARDAYSRALQQTQGAASDTAGTVPNNRINLRTYGTAQRQSEMQSLLDRYDAGEITAEQMEAEAVRLLEQEVGGQYSISDTSDPNELESRIYALREEVQDAEYEALFYMPDDPSPEARQLRNRIVKLQHELDNLVEQERRAAVRTPLTTILDNLGRYRRSDLESLAEQVSDGAWDDYESLSRAELEEGLREILQGRMGEMNPLEAQLSRFGFYVRPAGENRVQYSISETDSDGNTLTAEQREFFRDSKVVDENGNLRVVYHGTDQDFTVFDRTKSRANMDIQGNFFSPWQEDAGGYGGNVESYYLNITNPADEATGYRALRRYQGQNEAGRKAREYLESLGYDGVNNGNEEYIAFYPEQIKRVDNQTPTDNPDIRYSLDENQRNQFISMLREYARGNWNEQTIREYLNLVKQNGEYDQGANAARPVLVPKKDADGNPVRRTARTVMGAKAIPESVASDIANLVRTGQMSYERAADKPSVQRAVDRIQNDGFERSMQYFSDEVRKGIASKDLVTLGQQLLINAANAGDGKATAELLNLYAQMGTSVGQATQAYSILRKLDPSDQLYGIQKTVSNLEEEIQKRFKDTKITIDPSLLEEFNNQTDQAGRDKVLEKIYQNVADQVPSTWREKWNAWRYMAMLTNPRTHIRNIAGNLLFQPVRAMKDKVAATMEIFVRAVSPKFERSKSFVSSPDLYRAAWNDFENVKDQISGNKYDDVRSEVNSRRKIFKSKIATPVEVARKANSWALEFEDTIFKRITYAGNLSRYLQSHGVTAQQLRSNQVDPALLSRARDYAGQEALKATYQDKNQFSDLLSRRFQENNIAGKVANAAIDAVLPFRRTPANILVRGFEYSPLGLAKSLTADLVQVKRGNMSGAEAINNIAAGLTGSGLFGLGVYLFSQGLVTSGGDEDEEQNDLNELTGKQNYALNLPGGGSVTLDWLAPEALPFFMGVEFMEALGQEGFDMETVTNALSSISEPMLELSMLQSLNDLIDSVSYAESSGKLVSMAGSAIISYLTQAVPTLGGQIERTTEEYRMSSFTDRNNPLNRDLQYALSRGSARTPGDYQQIPYIDAWGRRESNGGVLERAMNNFFNPAYTSQTNETAADQEIQRLLDAGQTGIVPDRVSQSQKVDDQYLSSEQYVEYAEVRGQTSYDVVSDMIESDAYQDMTDEEKANAIKAAYQYAAHIAAEAIHPDHESEDYVAEAQNAEEEFGISTAEYLLLKQNYGTNGIKRIKKLMGAGTSLENAMDVTTALDELEPKAGEDKVSDLQEYRAILDSVSNVDQQLSALETVMNESTYKKVSVGYRQFGVEPNAWVTVKEVLPQFDQPNDNGKLGTYTQAEYEAALDSFSGGLLLPGSNTITLTNQDKAVLWQLLTGSKSAKNNPYSVSIGNQVLAALENKESTADYRGLLNLPLG